MSTPALLRLREAHPDSRISLLTPAKLDGLWERHSAIDTFLTFEPGEGAWSVARRLRLEMFDLAVVLPNSFRAALEVWLAGIPDRVGYRGQLRGKLLTRPIADQGEVGRMRKRSPDQIRRLIQPGVTTREARYPDSAHHIHHYLRLVASLGARPEPVAPTVVVADTEVQAFLERWGIDPSDSAPVFGLNPGAEYGPAKRWPAERFAAAAVEIRKRMKCRWLIFGGPGDQELAAGITAELNRTGLGDSNANPFPIPGTAALDLSGRTTLRELAAGLKACRVLLTNDTGPMHLAAAVGTPVVALFGSTSPVLTGPGLPGSARHTLLQTRVPCAPCFLRECPIDLRCMTRIHVDAVVEAVMRAKVE